MFPRKLFSAPVAGACSWTSVVELSRGGGGMLRSYERRDLTLATIPAEDPETYAMISRADTSQLDGPPPGLLNRLSGVAHDRELRELRPRLWLFTRDPTQGLPASSLPASGQWLPLLQERVAQLLREIQRDFGLAPLDGLTRRLTRALLPAGPLSAELEVEVEQEPKARGRTVHQVKGESIDAVLYVANRANVEVMLNGMDTEVGRIGYAAVTCARNLLWLAVPTTALVVLRPRLEQAGFLEVGQVPGE